MPCCSVWAKNGGVFNELIFLHVHASVLKCIVQGTYDLFNYFVLEAGAHPILKSGISPTPAAVAHAFTRATVNVTIYFTAIAGKMFEDHSKI